MSDRNKKVKQDEVQESVQDEGIVQEDVQIELKTKIEQLENQLKRAVADYINLSRRVEEDRKLWIKVSNQELILRLLPGIDYLETALKGIKDSGEKSNWVQGIELAAEEIKRALKEEGLEQIPEENATMVQFDPNLHEAIEVKEGHPEGVIVDIFQKGYNLNGKLIRPARVSVGKGK